ncbi:MAG: hypothetical protein ACTSPN_01170 [Promethearchaeota archaeon]
MSEEPQIKQEWQHASLVSGLGKWAWIAGLINGILSLIFGIWLIIVEISLIPYYELLGIPPSYFGGVWAIIGAIILIFVSFAIIKPKFSSKCAEKDWEALYGWTLALGGTKIPWMLIWGIIFTIFSWYYWGGIFVLLPAILLLFNGPRPYNWSE